MPLFVREASNHAKQHPFALQASPEKGLSLSTCSLCELGLSSVREGSQPVTSREGGEIEAAFLAFWKAEGKPVWPSLWKICHKRRPMITSLTSHVASKTPEAIPH